MTHHHPSHKEHLGKLNRISGQVEAIKRMITNEEYCVDILIQVKAARNALKSVELAILKTHMQSCLTKACCDEHTQEQKIEEIMLLLKKYE